MVFPGHTHLLSLPKELFNLCLLFLLLSLFLIFYRLLIAVIIVLSECVTPWGNAFILYTHMVRLHNIYKWEAGSSECLKYLSIWLDLIYISMTSMCRKNKSLFFFKQKSEHDQVIPQLQTAAKTMENYMSSSLDINIVRKYEHRVR